MLRDQIRRHFKCFSSLRLSSYNPNHITHIVAPCYYAASLRSALILSHDQYYTKDAWINRQHLSSTQDGPWERNVWEPLKKPLEPLSQDTEITQTILVNEIVTYIKITSTFGMQIVTQPKDQGFIGLWPNPRPELLLLHVQRHSSHGYNSPSSASDPRYEALRQEKADLK